MGFWSHELYNYADRGGNAAEGVQGVKFLGCRELTYKLAFLASSVEVSRLRFERSDKTVLRIL